jgi:hypothetical protein
MYVPLWAMQVAAEDSSTRDVLLIVLIVLAIIAALVFIVKR